MNVVFQATLARLDSMLTPELRGLSSRRLTQARLAVLLALATGIWGPVFIAVYLFIGTSPTSVAVLVVATILCVSGIPVLRATGSLFIASLQVSGALWFAIVGLTTFTGGLGAAALPWISGAPILALAIGGWRPGGWMLGASTLATAGFAVLALLGIDLPHTIDPLGMTLLHGSGGVSLTLFLFSIVALYQVETETMARRLETQVHELAHANRTKSVFMANMSHELRTPMNAILGYSELVSEVLEEQEESELAQDVGRVLVAGNQLLSLIDDLLDLSRIEAGGMELVVADVDLVELCTTVKSTLVQEAKERGKVLRSEVSSGVVRADRVRAMQILCNLVHNGLKFGASEVVLRAFAEEGTAVFEVVDDGPGLSPEDLKRVFEEFQQAHPAIRAAHGGTGLGLTISRKLAEAMGGTLTGSSVSGQGCTFRLTLPLTG